MTAPDPAGSREELRELVVALLEEIERDGWGALDKFCAGHPEQADEVRRRVASLREFGLVGVEIADWTPRRLGDFRLVERIGSGGMGLVYQAVQESLGREVALKLIRPEMLHLPEARRRFAREMESIARMQHPGIVPIYTVGGGEFPYYAMELVQGCTLAEALAEIGSRPPNKLVGADLARAVVARTRGAKPEDPQGALYSGSWEQVALRVVRSVALALDHAHSRGVLHRDIKPSNVMLTPGGRVMLVDFGLSQLEGFDSLTRTGERAGSLAYMPPELLESGMRALDRRSEVYSLGVTLFQLLTLSLPFQGNSEAALVASIVDAVPRRLRALLPGASWEAETVCLVALERDPTRRYASAGDFARDLVHVLERRPVEARRAGAWLRARRFVQRRPAASAALVLAVLSPTAIAVLQVSKAHKVAAALGVAVEKERLANANFERALGAVETMLHELGARKLDHVPGTDALRKELLERAKVLYAELGKERPDDPHLAASSASCALLEAHLLRRGGRPVEAAALARATLDLLEPRMPGATFELRCERARALAMLADCTDDLAAAAPVRRRALAALAELRKESPDDAALRKDELEAQISALLDARHGGETDADAVDLDSAQLLAREVLAEEPGSYAEERLARILAVKSFRLQNDGKLDEARGPLTEALELRKRVLAAHPSDENARDALVESASNLGALLLGKRELEEARAVLELAAAEGRRNRIDFPDVEAYARQEVGVELNLGAAQGLLGRHAEARTTLEAAAEAQARILERNPSAADEHRTLGTILLNTAGALKGSGAAEAGLATCARALESLEHAVELAPRNADIGHWLAIERITRAGLLLELGRIAEAAESLTEAPKLARHRADVASQGLKRMLVCLERAQATGDPELLRNCEVAARAASAFAVERGDLAQDPTLARLQVLTGGP